MNYDASEKMQQDTQMCSDHCIIVGLPIRLQDLNESHFLQADVPSSNLSVMTVSQT